MKNVITNTEELPIFLDASHISQVFGISRAQAYVLMHSNGFPTIRIGKRMVVPKEKLLLWIDYQVAK